MASYQVPRVPSFARELSSSIVQIHSRDYRNPSQLQDGPVLIVGAGNSGAEIAAEVSRSHETFVAGRDTGHVPFRMGSLTSRALLPFLFRVVFHRVLTIRTPLGRKLRPRMVMHGGPLIRVKPKDLAAAGVRRVPRVASTSNGLPLLDDGRVLDVKNVIWCTGFTPGFSWIDLPVVGADDEPAHEGGIVQGEPGLYFVGLHFLYAFSSTMIHGIARDAERVATAIAARGPSHERSTSPGTTVYASSYTR
jgi:putative flavoprotein involved in K+ transport